MYGSATNKKAVCASDVSSSLTMYLAEKGISLHPRMKILHPIDRSIGS